VHPELIIVEIIGEDDQPVPDGQVGEIVVTTLGVEGMPLLRFRTGDMAAKITDQCRCGRWSYRLTPLVGRKNNMIKFKGTTLYPPMIVDVLDNCRDIANYQLVLSLNDLGNDDVKVRIGVPDPDPDRDARLTADLKNTFRAKIRVAPEVEVCRADLLARDIYLESSRKPLKVVDLRPKTAPSK
jgi:phenylacetate-CoA ligase